MWRPLGRAFIIAVSAMLILGAMPQLVPAGLNHAPDITVFHAELEESISNDNLVDHLAALPLKQRLHHVQWQHAVLAIDLSVKHDASAAQLNRDLLLLMRMAFVKSDNVNRLLVRFIDRDAVEQARPSKKDALLLAADIRQSDEDLYRYLPALEPADLTMPIWRERFRLSYTNAWKQRYGPLPQ